MILMLAVCSLSTSTPPHGRLSPDEERKNQHATRDATNHGLTSSLQCAEGNPTSSNVGRLDQQEATTLVSMLRAYTT